MKKKLFILICLIVMTVIGVFSSKHQFNESNMFDNNCEALTNCDITLSYFNKETEKTEIYAQLICEDGEGECKLDYKIPAALCLAQGIPFGSIGTVSCNGKTYSSKLPE